MKEEVSPMANANRATQGKRNRELARRDRQQEKEEKRAARKEQKEQRSQDMQDGIDPDLEGIVAGPQPPRED